MKKIGEAFGVPGRKALIGYLTVGYPDVEATLDMVPLLATAGCDLVELGIPFSDPLADGPTIQRASYHALTRGTTPALCLDVAGKLQAGVDIPLVFMTYFNTVHNYGLQAFCRDCAGAGVSGMIVPDLPPEEGACLEEASLSHGLDLVYLLAPTSTDERIELVSKKSRGFIYLVSVTGVTGARDRLPEDLECFVSRVRSRAALPLCVGFGISTPEEAKRVAGVADGVIVGSRLIQLLGEPDGAARLEAFIRSLRDCLSDHHDT